MPDSETISILHRLSGQLLRCRWIDGVSVSENRWVVLSWTLLGQQRGFLLAQVIGRFGLADSNISLVQFTRETCKARQPRHADSRKASGEFWTACLEELNLLHQEDEREFRLLVNLLSPASGTLPSRTFEIRDGTLVKSFLPDAEPEMKS